MKPRLVIPIAVGAAIGISAGVLVARHNSSPPNDDGTGEQITEASSAADETELAALQTRLQNTLVLPEDFREVPAFSLVGKDGSAVDETLFDGRWTMTFFGYTHCPDVCPITLQVMKEVVAELQSDEADPMQVAFFTVDPKRDTQERMNEYVGFFDPSFRGVTGELTNVLDFTRGLGIVAAFTANDDDPENYLVDHTASMLLIDPQGRVRAKFNPPHEAATILADYREIVTALN
jgi:protein SCO1/2